MGGKPIKNGLPLVKMNTHDSYFTVGSSLPRQRPNMDFPFFFFFFFNF